MPINIYPNKRISSLNIRVRSINVRLATEDEKQRWNNIVSEFHYLGNANMAGNQLRYIVEFRGRCLGLLSFSAPALKLAGRDAWIGWDDEQRRRRLPFIVQNSRFLILPWIKSKNLASRILSLTLKQLPNDWHAQFGYRPLLVESFVDRCFKGTSYRAANWIRLGETAGFSRDAKGFYKHNGSPKSLWVKPLKTQTREILCAESMPEEFRPFELPPDPKKSIGRLKSDTLDSLFAAMHQIEEDRVVRGKRHSLATCLAVVVCGIMAGCRGLSECAEVAKSFSGVQRKKLCMWRDRDTGKPVPPSHTTLWRTLSKIDPLSFENAILGWYNSQANSLPPAMAIDGKAIRATLDSDNVGLHVVSAVPHDDTPFLPRRQSNAKAMSMKQ